MKKKKIQFEVSPKERDLITLACDKIGGKISEAYIGIMIKGAETILKLKK